MKIFKRFCGPAVSAVLAVTIGLFVAGPDAARAEKLKDFVIDEAKLPFAALPGAAAMWGVHKNAGYRIEVPDAWNGKLVMYAHGFRGAQAADLAAGRDYRRELTVDSPPRLRQHLIDNGFAWAASSFSKNEYNITAGVQDTMALAHLFNGLVGKPSRTYITGHSMGGHVTGVAIEQYPKAFDGAVPMCGVMGDNELFDYLLSFNLVAQALTGNDAGFPVDPATYPALVVTQIVPALGTPYPVALTPAGQALAGVTMNLTGGPRPAFATGFFVWNSNLTDFAPGFPFLFQFGLDDGSLSAIAAGNVTGNIDTVYQMDADPALSPEELYLNSVVRRVSEDPQGRHPNGISGIPVISGDIGIPVVSIHTLGDLFVPFSMEQIYARRAAANGKADMLVSRAIRDVGHCAFAVEEEVQAFQDMVNWAENGVKPGGDDILTPATVADPDFGCNYTLIDRPFLAACP